MVNDSGFCSLKFHLLPEVSLKESSGACVLGIGKLLLLIKVNELILNLLVIYWMNARLRVLLYSLSILEIVAEL